MNKELYAAKIRELNELATKYKKRLRNIEDDYLRGCAAMVCHNQSQYNETVKMPNFLKQISVPAGIHTIGALPNIFGVQVSKVADSDVYFYLDKAGDPDSIIGKPYKTSMQPNLMMRNIDVELDPEELALQCVEVAVTQTDDIVRMAVEDIMFHAGHNLTSELQSVSSLVETIKNASDTIKESIGRPANFVILPVMLARFIKSELITEYDFDALPTNIKRVGCLRNKWTVYINAYESRKILVGYRGTHPADAGYVFCPCLQFCEPKKDGDKYVIHRRAKNMLPHCNYYACVELTADRRTLSIDEF